MTAMPQGPAPGVPAHRAQSFLERLKSQMPTVGGDPMGRAKFKRRERVREVVRTNRFDKLEFKKARKAEVIDELVEDLYRGDQVKGGERPAFEQAPELVEAMFHVFHKTAPELLPPRAITRDMRMAQRITKEMMDNPRLQDLHEYTATDPTMSIMAVDSMGEALREILERVGEPPPEPGTDPNGPQQGGQPGPGGGGGGGGQPGQQQGGQPGGGGGQGGGQQQPQQQPPGGGQPGQPDPNGGGQPGGGQPGDGGEGEEGNVPPPPEERDAEEDEEENEDDLTDGDQEFDPEADWEEQEAEWERQFDETLQDIDLDRLANRALEQAYKDVQEVENLRKGIGLDDGTWATMDPSERMAMVKQLQTPEMKALADIVGRMRRFSLGIKQTRVNDVPHEAFDVTLGRDVRHVLKSEFALLANPVTKIEFFRKYAEGTLLQYKLRGTEEVGKGPIVICVDKSGSMNGQPFRWALAVCEALRRFALEDERDIFIIFFGSDNDRTRFDYPKGQGEFKKVLTMMGTIANGGTQFAGVLSEALGRATEYFDGEGKGKADIVFITDGMAHLSDEWITDFNVEKHRVGVRLYSVFVGGASDMRYGQGPQGLLERISDATIPIRELTPESVQHVFTHV